MATGCQSPSRPGTESRLLQVPTELRLKIIEFALDELPRVNDPWSDDKPGWIQADRGGWVPPPLLQTCHTLRSEGLELFTRLKLKFRVDIVDYNVTLLISIHNWRESVLPYYKIPVDRHMIRYIRLADYAVVGDGSHPQHVEDNLWQWLEAFYLHDAPGLFLKRNVDKTKFRRHVLIHDESEEFLDND